MRTFKKKNFKEDYIPDDELEETQEFLGSGDEHHGTDEVGTNSLSLSADDDEAKKGIPTTTDKAAKSAHGSMSRLHRNGTGISTGTVREEAKGKMVNMIDEFLTDKINSPDFVNRSGTNRNEVPDINNITGDNLVLSNAVNDLVKALENVGDSKTNEGVLNYLTSKLTSQNNNI